MAKKRTISTASTSTTNQNVWYACGKALPAGMLSEGLQRLALDHIKETMPNLVPTTYEAAEAYLREEFKKPKEEQYLRREMCMIIPISLPKDRKAYFVIPSIERVIELVDGAILVLPTVEVPPDSFGSPENVGILDSKDTGVVDHNMLIFDPPTSTPQKGIIILSYLTKSGPDKPVNSPDCIQLNTTPYT